MKKIVIIGPESTGKSTLCTQLAAYYHTNWCAEYAREYLLKNGMEYSCEDLLTIAKGQLQLEDEAAELAQHTWANKQISTAANALLFIDTDMYVMKVWCEYVFGKCHPFVLEEIAERKYDLYLLCNIDLPWIKDELREYPDEGPRQELYHIYKDILLNQPVPWVDVSGDYEVRLQAAINGIEKAGILR